MIARGRISNPRFISTAVRGISVLSTVLTLLSCNKRKLPITSDNKGISYPSGLVRYNQNGIPSSLPSSALSPDSKIEGIKNPASVPVPDAGKISGGLSHPSGLVRYNQSGIPSPLPSSALAKDQEIEELFYPKGTEVRFGEDGRIRKVKIPAK
jgi:hypothetical protein